MAQAAVTLSEWMPPRPAVGAAAVHPHPNDDFTFPPIDMGEPFPLIRLPPELRLRVFKFAFQAARSRSTFDHLALYPRKSYTVDPATCLQDLKLPGVMALVLSVLNHGYQTRECQPGCQNCALKFKEPSMKLFCWRCKKTGYGLLLTCREVFGEAIEILYASQTPTFTAGQPLFTFVYCMRSQNRQAAIRLVSLEFWLMDMQDRPELPGHDSVVGQGFGCWYNLPKPGFLLCAFPGLQVLEVIFNGPFQLITGPLGPLACYPEVGGPGLLQKDLETLAANFKDCTQIEVRVQDLWLSRTKAAAQKALKEGTFGDYSIEQKVIRFLVGSTEVDWSAFVRLWKWHSAVSTMVHAGVLARQAIVVNHIYQEMEYRCSQIGEASELYHNLTHVTLWNGI